MCFYLKSSILSIWLILIIRFKQRIQCSHVSLPTTINRFIEFQNSPNFNEKWENYESNSLFSTKVNFLRDEVQSNEIFDFLENAEDLSKYKKMKEFGVKIRFFGEEMIMKVLVVNEKKVQFQIKGEEKQIASKILNFMLFLFAKWKDFFSKEIIDL